MDDYADIHVLLRLPPDAALRHLVWPMSVHMHLPVIDVFAPSVLFLAFRVPGMRDRLLCACFCCFASPCVRFVLECILQFLI